MESPAEELEQVRQALEAARDYGSDPSLSAGERQRWRRRTRVLRVKLGLLERRAAILRIEIDDHQKKAA